MEGTYPKSFNVSNLVLKEPVAATTWPAVSVLSSNCTSENTLDPVKGAVSTNIPCTPGVGCTYVELVASKSPV